MRRLELALVALVVAGGAWLRVVHLGTPGIWWDELVHIRTAEQPDVLAVWHAVRDGVAPRAAVARRPSRRRGRGRVDAAHAAGGAPGLTQTAFDGFALFEPRR